MKITFMRFKHNRIIKFFMANLPFVLIFILAAFVRLYKIDQYMTFLGDEGRDVLIVKRMLIDHKFTLLGPITSVGSMYLGPIYYYFMLPFLLLFNFNPVGPAVMIALFSLITITLIYSFCKEYLNLKIGLIAAFLYSLSPFVIVHSRSSWNPNAAPLFAMLLIYSLAKVVIEKKYHYLIAAGGSLGVILQLHYLALTFLIIIPLILLLSRFKIPTRSIFYFIISFLVTLAPFILFEFRHGFPNLHTMVNFILSSEGSGNFHFSKLFTRFTDFFIRAFWRLVIIESAEITKVFLIITIFAVGLYFLKNCKNKQKKKALFIIFIWFFTIIFLYSVYQGVIYDYYFVTFFPLPFIFTAIVLYELFFFKKQNLAGSILKKSLAVVIFLVIVFFQVTDSPLRKEPNNMLLQTKRIAQLIYDKSEDGPFNFALIAQHNSDHAYRYFLEILGNKPIEILNPQIDPERKSVTKQLFVVCEEKLCKPLGHSLWEIAGFGRAQTSDTWQVFPVKIFKLVPYQDTDFQKAS